MKNKIIHFLKQAQGYISGEEISQDLKISRSGIWKHMQELRKEGYDIVAVPHLGYRLVSCPDKLLPSEIQYGLMAKRFGSDIRYFDSVNSTMDVAFQLGLEGAREGTVVCAEGQTKGKGRLGRSWISAKGKGLYMSIVLRPQLTPSDAAKLTLLSAVATCETIEKLYGIPVKIKWPNDILVKEKKLAGILTELSAEMDRVRFVIVGIGVNVNTSLSQLPPSATSIKSEIGHKSSRIKLVQEILLTLEKWYEILCDQGFNPVLAQWKRLSSTIGRRVRISDFHGHVEGEAIDLDEFGGLIIKNDSGEIVKRITGDVVQVE